MYPIFAYARKFKRFIIYHKSKSEFLIMHARELGFDSVSDMLKAGIDAEECKCRSETCPGWKIKIVEMEV